MHLATRAPESTRSTSSSIPTFCNGTCGQSSQDSAAALLGEHKCQGCKARSPFGVATKIGLGRIVVDLGPKCRWVPANVSVQQKSHLGKQDVVRSYKDSRCSRDVTNGPHDLTFPRSILLPACAFRRFQGCCGTLGSCNQSSTARMQSTRNKA
eukprot:6197753-Pleurochrysis_carterae.AAC.3